MERMRPILLALLITAAGCQSADDQGAAAGAGEDSAACGSTSDCGPGLRCHRNACTSEAHDPGEPGDACQITAHCAVPLACIDGACADLSDEDNPPGEEAVAGPWIQPEGCDLEYPFGFVSLITGPTAVVDLCSCNRDGDGRLERLSEVGQGHFITHGVGVDRRRGELWYGNQGTNSLQRLRLSADLLTYEVVAEQTIAAGLSTIRRSPNGRYVATGAAEPQMVPPSFDEFAKNRAMFLDTGLNSIEGIVQSPSPGAVFFSADSSKVWIPDINDRQVSEVHLSELAMKDTPIHRVIPLPWPEDKAELIGPSPFLDQTLDYRWIAIPGLDAELVWVFDVESDWEVSWQYETPGERPHMVAWAPDGKRLWVTTFTRWPTPLDGEPANPSIPAYIHVVDAQTHERIARFQWSPAGKNTAVWHVEITPDGGHAWVSGSYAAVIGFNLKTFEPECAVNLHAGPQPAMTLDY